jgi:tight adherence protein B
VTQALPPLSQEFGLMLREQRLGLGFQDALQKLRERMPTESCGLVVSALSIAAQTGGSLADTLEGIAQTLRARQHWLGRVRALTAQGRMQSHIMAGLPILLLLVLSRLEPEAMDRLWSTALGWAVLLLIFVLECLGTVWIRRVVAVEV